MGAFARLPRLGSAARRRETFNSAEVGSRESARASGSGVSRAAGIWFAGEVDIGGPGQTLALGKLPRRQESSIEGAIQPFTYCGSGTGSAGSAGAAPPLAGRVT